jgi:cytochrome c-type biogenesis protein CcmH/NrfG
MATARIVCSDCGAQLSPGDAFCSSCGAKIDSPAVNPGSATVQCGVCGYQNPAGGAYCEGCGAKLPGATVREEKRPGKEPQRPRKLQKGPAGKKAPTGDRRRVEPWQIVSGIAVLGLIGFLVYMQVFRQQFSAATFDAPPASMVTAAPKVFRDVAPLQKAVDDNPRNPAAWLQLANALHDNGMYLRAIEAYKKYLAIVPGNPDARVDLGICYYLQAQADSVNGGEEFNLALQEMETALKSHPDHQPSAFNLGIVNLYLGNLTESNKWFKRAVEINKSTDLGVRAQKILDEHSSVQQ